MTGPTHEQAMVFMEYYKLWDTPADGEAWKLFRTLREEGVLQDFERFTERVPSGSDEYQTYVQGFVTPQGRRILLVNRSNAEETATVPAGFEHAQFATVDEATGDDAPRTGTLTGPQLTLAPFAVTVLKAE